VLRFLELCIALEVPVPTLLTHALQRARLFLANLALQVDLRALLNDQNDKFRPMVQWARNKLNKHPSGVVSVASSSVEELADFAGYSTPDLADYLAKFIPDNGRIHGTDVTMTSAAPGGE